MNIKKNSPVWYEVDKKKYQQKLCHTLNFEIKLINKNEKGKAILFGYTYAPYESKNENCTVKVLQSSHHHVKVETLHSHFTIKGVKYKAKNINQFINNFKIIEETFLGRTMCSFWQPSEHINLIDFDNRDTIIDPSFTFKLNPDRRIEIDINKNEELSIIFYIEPSIEYQEINPII